MRLPFRGEKEMKTKLIVIIAALFTGLVFHMPAGAVQTIDLFSEQSIDSRQDYRDGNRVLRSSTVKINPDFIEAMEGVEIGYDLSLMQLRMTFFFELPMIAVFNRWERVSPTGLALIGSIQGIPGSEVIFVTKGSVLTGNITLPGQLFQIRPTGKGPHELQEIDRKSFPEHLEPIPVPTEPEPFTLDLPVPDDTQIDVMVVYTAVARAAAGGTTAIESLIDLGVVETNQGYTNSGITQRISLVHKVETDYSETGFDWNTTLSRLQQTADGYMDNVHTLRDTYHADVVVMIVDNQGYCGLGYLMQTVSPSFAAYAFCLVSRVCTTGYYSFAHEMGHNMGAHHDRANASSAGAYPYSYGYQAPDEAFRTVMAYDCPGGCQRINYWSNPDVSYGGQQTGVLYTASDSADNRRTLNNTVSTVANFRASSGLSLSVEKTGTGTGTVTSVPIGISCGSTCSASFSQGTAVTLTATADASSTFISWTDCDLTDGNTCFVTMTAAKSVSASFSLTQPIQYTLTVGKNGTGTGRVTGTGIDCGIDCTQTYDSGTSVILNAAADTGSVFGGWSGGGCSGTGTCTVTMNANVAVVATFNLLGSLSVNEGTSGTQITIAGSDFGSKKGKVYIGGLKQKVEVWSDTSITVIFTKYKGLVTGTPLDVSIQWKPKGSKTTNIIVLPGAFTLRKPEINPVNTGSGSAGDLITINGMWFGTKKGKVYLGQEKCKVKSWTMNPTTGVSSLVFEVTNKLGAATYFLEVENKIGRSLSIGFEVK